MANAHAKLFNDSGHPSVVIPHALASEGLPIGLQLVGKRWEEARLLGGARAIAEVAGSCQPPAYSGSFRRRTRS
ncbi:MAG: hypothetical protein R3272_06410 [Candidatus Promineifilaceae bacterium]|nr:hypothetical protein [Candidatus Promineifilaceae bacterium]